MAQYTKHIGKVVISDPDDVQSKCSDLGIGYFKGMVFCTIPEVGFLNSDLVPCRYGLSIPYIRVQEDWELLIEPTIIESGEMKKRWFYTGIADCGGDDCDVNPTTNDAGIIKIDEGIYLIQIGNYYLKIDETANEITQFINASGKMTLKTSGVELGAGSDFMVKGTTHKTALTTLCTTIAGITPAGSSAANIAAILAAFATFNTSLANMLSTKHKVD